MTSLATNMPLMSISGKQELVIDILRDREMYGLDLVEKSGGKLKRGTVYVTLSTMEQRGLIEAREIPSKFPEGLPRRLYRVTEGGMREFLSRHSPLPKAVVVSD